MTKREKVLKRLLGGQMDADLAFQDLCSTLNGLGFRERIRGGHHIFSREGIVEIINLQPVNGKAKPYQVKQVRNILRKYHLDKDKE